MPAGPVAVIDIGSNSIKGLVAATGPGRGIWEIDHQAVDARISSGIGGAVPSLGDEGRARALAAVETILAQMARYQPKQVAIVATSAVREAANSAEFCKQVHAHTGHRVRVLTGQEEARLIGRGLLCDPTLAHLRDFLVLDLGGGSLEGLMFRGRQVIRAVSLPLGCVRLSERFSPNSSAPLTKEAAAELSKHIRSILQEAQFDPLPPPGGVAIGLGGTFTTLRAMIAARQGKEIAASDPVLRIEAIRELRYICDLTLEQRYRVPGLPKSRADVFPVAYLTVQMLAELGSLSAFHHSYYNLRWGVAAEMLA